MKIAFCKSTTPIPSNRYWSIKRVLVPQAPKILNHLCGKSLEPNGRPISRSHSFKSNRNTATQLCLKLYWHAVFHTQEHTTILQRSYQHCLGALGAGLTSSTLYTLRSWSGKLNCVHHLVMGAHSKLHSRFCMNAGTSNSFLFDQQISRTTIIAHSTCLWARIHRPGCSVNNPGNLNETPLTRSLFSSFVFSVGHSSRPNSPFQLLINEALVVEVEQVEVDQVVVKGSMVS
jgi:hypothetical protein